MSNNVMGRNTDDAPDTPQHRRRQATLDRFLAVALDIVSSDGFGGLTLSRVAEATDYTRAALYRYFDSKEALISALTVRVIESVAARVQSRLAADSSDCPLEKVRAACDEYVGFAHDCPAQFAMLSVLMAQSDMVLSSDDTARPALSALEEALAPLAVWLDAAARSRQLSSGDAGARAAVLFASVHGALQLRKQSERSSALPSTRALCELAADSLLAGWKAAPDARETRSST